MKISEIPTTDISRPQAQKTKKGAKKGETEAAIHQTLLYSSQRATETLAMAAGDTNGCWTDEKHFSFLNRLEDSFVKTMLQRSDLTYGSRHAYHPPALDRYLPDCADSTHDTKRPSCLQRRQTHLNNEIAERNVQRDARRKANGTMTLPFTDDNASEDQIVPKLAQGKVITGKDE